MKRVDDSEHYYNQFQNNDGYIVGLYNVMFGTRVVAYHPEDGSYLPLSLCGGSNNFDIIQLYSYIFHWLETNPKNFYKTCEALSKAETVRPYGKSKELKIALKLLPSSLSKKASQ